MFGFSNKPGAGITKEQAAKRNYFDIFGRHFGGIIGVSSLYTLSNLLFFIAALLIFRAYFTEENVVKILSNVMSGKNFICPAAPGRRPSRSSSPWTPAAALRKTCPIFWPNCGA